MRILTHDQLHRTAPAVFASQPDEAVSDRYGFVPTINVVDALQAEGWYPVRLCWRASACCGGTGRGQSTG